VVRPVPPLAPTVDALAADYVGQGVGRQDERGREPRDADAVQVRGIPTVMLFKGGQLVDQVVGLADKDARDDRSARLKLASHAS
jgi:thioredoxin 1